MWAAVAVLNTPAWTAQADDNFDFTNIYNTIKAQEAAFPIPTPAATVQVGTFDAATGQFTFASGVIRKVLQAASPDEMEKSPKQKEKVSLVNVNAVRVDLVFQITHRQGDFRITVNGVSTEAPSGQNSLTVTLRDEQDVDWEVKSGSKRFHDRLVVQRPPLIGAGVFTIPALPLAIIYSPPLDRQKKNYATYSNAYTFATTVRMSFSTDKSETKPVLGQFDTVSDLKIAMKRVAAAIAVAPKFPHAAAIAAALNKIADEGLGKVTAEQTSGTKVTDGHTLTVQQTLKWEVATDPMLGGPGRSDKILFLQDARIAWLAENGKVHLALIGHRLVGNHNAGFLVAHRNSPRVTGLLPETTDSLLALDPFVSALARGNQPSLDSNRYARLDAYEVTSPSLFIKLIQETTLEYTHATLDSLTTVEDYTPGFLSFLGLGVTEERKLRTTISHESVSGQTTGMQEEAGVNLYAQSDELYAVEVYYDRIFHTFAFRLADSHAKPKVAGRVLDRNGRPLAHQRLTLQTRTARFTTQTDAQGNFAFHAAAIAPGDAVLIVRELRHNLRITESPVLQIELRLGKN